MEDQSLKPIRCKAAVCRANGAPLVIEDIFVDAPKAYEIRIKIICTSLCHTDLTFWRVKEEFGIPPLFPRILGHEAYGVVESVGERVEGYAAGDTVVPTFLGQCESCSSCASEGNNMCSAVPFALGPGMRRDGTTRFRDTHGAPLHDLMAVSSFSQYTVVDVNQVVKVDASVPPKLACILGCGAGTGVGAAWKLAKVEPASSVAVFGLGAVGLSGAKMCGASKIIGVDLNPDKRELGKIFGVTDFINPSELGESSVVEVIIKMTGGGADYCFECIGLASVMTDAFRSCKQGKGKTVILGVEQDGKPICLPAFEFLFGKCVMGSLFGGIKPKTDIPILAEKCMNKELELEKLITHELDLQDINTAFDLLVQGKSLRCIIWMEKLVV
ncbi:alcohol dehydrogenase-like 2 isoform X2 [Brachypodium distachyon]|uniref:alcohol dehydrogenase-like 2 isoform X2 n=1 Tax=Brachypodium distachyon TaxID=15368 RepID=UPI000D0E2738|nr:alcohol dehydrogenase-like 2 isoform X2 [Brachypodium distachyon]|eukprot:XP_024316514.1 alcohol dehydrogenase-like 2 isoform X2 [Brachypodium distachyon]